MCIGLDPISGAIIGGVMSAAGTIASAAAANANAQAQAEQTERQAMLEERAGAYEKDRLEDQNTRALDRMRSSYLSSGIGLTDSAADVIADSATEASLDEQAVAFSTTARVDTMNAEARATRASGKNAMIAGIIGAGTSLYKGMSGSQQTSTSQAGALRRESRLNQSNLAMINNPYLI